MDRQQNKSLEISSRRASFFLNFDKKSRQNRDRRPRVPASIYKRQKQSLSYASPLVVYWDPLQDHSWNDMVCHESLSQCLYNFSSSPKFKNSIFEFGSLRSIRAN